MEIMTNKSELHNIVQLDELQNNLKNYLQLAAAKGVPVHEVEKNILN